MTSATTARPRAFAVYFKDLDRWDTTFFRGIHWAWPKDFFVPMSSLLEAKSLAVDSKLPDSEKPIIDKITFGGEIFVTEPDARENYKGRLFWAHTGDFIYSKIRVKQGSCAIVPPTVSAIAVSTEYPVYRILVNKVLPAYFELLVRCQPFLKILDGLSHGGSTKTRIHPSQFEAISVPIPPIPTQQAIVDHWKNIHAEVIKAENRLVGLKQRVNDYLHSLTIMEPCERRALTLSWDKLESWDVKSSRAAAFKLANPTFKPLSEYAEEATELARPKLEPQKDWPLYGVNNKEGVFFSDYQKGADFNAPYKRIRKDWFFHNPTRSSVGSLGIVPEVPDDAITSPEYQVWRIRTGLLNGFAAVMITTEYFIKLIQFNRVGAVKQRLYVENLLSIPIPEIPAEFQHEVADEREKALAAIAEARAKVAGAAVEVEAMILGTKKVDV